MLPLGAVEWMARLLPWLELGVGASLIIGAGVRWAGLVVTALLLVFMVALAHAALGGAGDQLRLLRLQQRKTG